MKPSKSNAFQRFESGLSRLASADPAERPYDGRMARYVMQLYED